MSRILGIVILLTFCSAEAPALELQTRESKLCGVDHYETHTNDTRCPVDQYQSLADSACNEIFKGKEDGRVCGFDTDRVTTQCIPSAGSHNPPIRVAPDPDFGCPRGYDLVKSPTPKWCRDKSFGHEGWESCRSPAHPPESYKPCENPEFGVKSYKVCSFYKSPEELNAYIDATNESLEEYRMILPNRQGDLFAVLKSENGLGCTIQKYSKDPEFEDVVTELSQQFFIIFGYPYADATLDCSPESLKSTKIVVKVATLDCDSLPADLTQVVKPDSVTDNQFKQFRKNCNLKRSYDTLVNWFIEKSSDTTLLIDDLAAQADPAAKQSLQDLQAKLKVEENQ